MGLILTVYQMNKILALRSPHDAKCLEEAIEEGGLYAQCSWRVW